MTPISKHDGKLVVRNGSTQPSPCLRKQERLLKCLKWEGRNRAVDLGCGNGRNTEYLKSLGFDVLPFDWKADYGHVVNLSTCNVKGLPVFKKSVNVILIQFVLMFMPKEQAMYLVHTCMNLLDNRGLIVIEVQPVKSGIYKQEALAKLLDDIVHYLKCINLSWKSVRIVRSKYKLLIGKDLPQEVFRGQEP